MIIAVVGAGLSGLAVTYYLLEKGATVDLFEAKRIGAGASGIASGLLHPYPGEDGKRTWMADEALAEARALFDTIGFPFIDEGILRIPRNEEERAHLGAALLRFPDVDEKPEGFFIKSGMTIDAPAYLGHLWRACEQKGAMLHITRIEDFARLSHYDAIILCAGASSPELTSLPAQKIKGQLLIAKADIPRSVIGKGYIAKSSQGCILGSTYERAFSSEEPDRQRAEEEILPKIAAFYPEAKSWQIETCLAGVRLARRGHYFPIVRKLDERKWIFTALGSRGLLYHAFLGKMLASAVVRSDENMLRRELL